MFAVEFPLPATEQATDDEAQEMTRHDAPPSIRDALRDRASQLQATKARVRVAVDTIGEQAWRRITHQELPSWANTIARRRPASRAYYKLWEIIRSCALPTATYSLHICEAPGGMIQACQDLWPGLRCVACSHACGPQFSSDLKSVSLLCDLPHHGNLLREDVRDVIVKRVASPVDMVSADGAWEMDHDDIERSAIDLIRAQIDVALRVLAPGGCFVLKIFEGCDENTCECIARLSMAFDRVSLFKPTHSRPTNSERYVVCVGRRSPTDGTFSTYAVVTPAWWESYASIITNMCDVQEKALRASLARVR